MVPLLQTYPTLREKPNSKIPPVLAHLPRTEGNRGRRLLCTYPRKPFFSGFVLESGSDVCQAGLSMWLRTILTSWFSCSTSQVPATSQSHATMSRICGAGGGTQGFVYTRQALYHLSYSPSLLSPLSMTLLIPHVSLPL